MKIGLGFFVFFSIVDAVFSNKLFIEIFLLCTRNNCGGNYACINECGGQSVSVAPVYVEPYNRCQSCPPGCGIQADQPVLDSCVAGKSLFYVQIPSNVTLNSIVSNADLLELYSNSKLELNANGISGRACLNNTTRFDLTQLNATIQPITDVKK